MTTESLYVSGYTEVTREWTEVGASPWLSDSDANYVYTKTDNAVHDEFTFADHEGSETIASIDLYMEIQGNSGRNDEIIIELWDGIQWIEIATLDPDNDSYVWSHWDVKATLDTWTKINGAKLRITYNRSGSPSTEYIYVRRAYLYVDYSSGPSQGWNKLQFTSEPPTGGQFNQLKYVTEPPVASAWNKLAYEGE